jgi:DNA-binding MarR family transcriptional regulator
MRRGIEERLAAWVTFLQAHAVLTDALERSLEHQVGLPLSSYEVLLRLSMAEGRLRMLDLSRSLLLSKSGITRLVDRMEEGGLVRRTPSPQDRRVTWVVLTDGGRRRFRQAMPVHLRGIEEHFSRPLGDEDVRALRSSLRKVLAANGHPDEACHSPGDFEGVCGTERRRPRAAGSRD